MAPAEAGGSFDGGGRDGGSSPPFRIWAQINEFLCLILRHLFCLLLFFQFLEFDFDDCFVSALGIHLRSFDFALYYVALASFLDVFEYLGGWLLVVGAARQRPTIHPRFRLHGRGHV